MSRRLQRIFTLLFLFGFAALLIYMGFEGWELNDLPAQYVGYLIGGMGVLGLFGVNIWYGGPFDMRFDSPEKPETFLKGSDDDLD